MPKPLSDSLSGALPLSDQVRQQLQLSLGVVIRARPVAGRFYPAGSELWQIDSAPYLLATRPVARHLLPGLEEPRSQQILFLYDYVPPELAAHLRAQHTSYADAAGNAWLHHPPLLVDMQGCPRPAAAERPAGPVRQVSLLRLLFQVVQQPALLSYSLPALAAHTALPLAAVQQARAQLLEWGFWPTTPGSNWLPEQLANAMRYWLAGFAPCLRRRLRAQRYCLRHPALWAEWPRARLPAGCWWGGEAAANLLLKHTEVPTSLTLYSQVARPQLISQLSLIPHAHGPVEVLNSFAPTMATVGTPCVSPLLVYADLLAGGLPLKLLAQELYANYLDD